MTKAKYHDAVMLTFEPLFESWMNESDKLEFVTECLATQGLTIAASSDQIQVGIDNGYPVWYQVTKCQEVRALELICTKVIKRYE